MPVPDFAQAGQDLAGLQQHQQGLQSAIDAGQLWMEPGVAERAAVACDQQVERVRQILRKCYRIQQQARFGANEDGEAAAARYERAGNEFVAVMEGAQRVFEDMAANFRKAGRAAAQAEEANQQMFRGGM
ncbi:MAG: hypothetical protein ACRDRZ_00670 [Pseudonocardiaceae bacterium]